MKYMPGADDKSAELYTCVNLILQTIFLSEQRETNIHGVASAASKLGGGPADAEFMFTVLVDVYTVCYAASASRVSRQPDTGQVWLD